MSIVSTCRRIGWIALLLGPACAVGADEVVLKNGKVLEAEAIEEQGDRLKLVTEFMTIEVARADVERIIRRPRPEAEPAAPRRGPGKPAEPAAAAKRRCAPPAWPEFGDQWIVEDTCELERLIAETGDDRYRRMLRILDDPDPRLIDDLVRIAAERDPALHRPALRTLGSFDGKEALGPLIRERRGKELSRSEAARDGLLRWCARNRRQGSPFLEYSYQQLDAVNVASLLETAAAFDLDWARPVLYYGMEWGRAEVRTVAWSALRAGRDPDLGRHLADGLGDVEWRVRLEAARACLDLEADGEIGKLVDLLGDAEPKVVTEAHAALVGLTGLEMPADSRAWREWWREVRGD